ncbi:unnamed protein product, partial [Prorocentrum cordatum]
MGAAMSSLEGLCGGRSRPAPGAAVPVKVCAKTPDGSLQTSPAELAELGASALAAGAGDPVPFDEFMASE